jgi:hypothetical protein
MVLGRIIDDNSEDDNTSNNNHTNKNGEALSKGGILEKVQLRMEKFVEICFQRLNYIFL